MKLKYYMRGLGLGIILTTLVLTIGKPKDTLSNQQIIDRAETLGMVTKEDSESNLDEVLDQMDLTGSPAPSLSPVLEPTVAPTIVPTVEPTLEPTKEPTVKPMSTKAPKSEQKEISFTIKRGMNSDQVAKMLEEEGLIENAIDFNKYIVKNGKANIIRVGTYAITQDSSYDEIIKKITKEQ